jgi:O-glycosyl hydrolase
LATTERAELGTEEYFAYSHVLENFVILAKNKGFEVSFVSFESCAIHTVVLTSLSFSPQQEDKMDTR